jgi:ketosteroid isomerase-like protein
MMSIDALQRLLIEQACQRLIHRYAYLNDERDFEALIALFTDDATLYRPSAPTLALQGREAILSSFRGRPADVRTFHLCSDVIVDVEDAGHASARSRIVLLSGARTENGVDAVSKPPAPGTFTDRLHLTAQGWKFAERRGAFWI